MRMCVVLTCNDWLVAKRRMLELGIFYAIVTSVDVREGENQDCVTLHLTPGTTDENQNPWSIKRVT